MNTLMNRLHRHRENRGLMASLRCTLVETKKHRAWPALHRLGIRIDDEVSACVAGLFATHPENTETGNLGDTCKAIERHRGGQTNSDGPLSATERRFQYLLAADGLTEAVERVQRIVFMAKANGIPVNYGALQRDLRFWGNRVKAEWAAAFWTQATEPFDEEAV